MKDRLKHLSAVENMQTISDPDFGRWADTRLDRWLVDWALRKGWEKTAKKIASEKGIEVRRSIYGEAHFVSKLTWLLNRDLLISTSIWRSGGLKMRFRDKAVSKP
jgi:hypothetical protein